MSRCLAEDGNEIYHRRKRARWQNDGALDSGSSGLYSCEINSLSLQMYKPLDGVINIFVPVVFSLICYYIKQLDSMLRELLFSSFGHGRHQNVVRTLVTSPRLFFFAGGGACSCAFTRQM